MRKYLILVTVCIYNVVSYSQNVGIGTPNPQNKLHVAGGFRLDTLTGVNGAGLLRHDANGVVYGIKFSGNANDVLRGDGSFGAFDINGAIGWLLNGNAGLNPSTHFLGTTDNVPFNIRVNNLRSGSIETASGNTSWGYQALLSNTAGQRNTAIGSEALSKNTLGNDNTAVGYNALMQNIGAGNTQEPIPFRGVQNTAVGSNALASNVTGSGNSAFGANAMSTTTASNGSAFGTAALEKNASFNSSAFGYNTLKNNIGGSYNSGFGAFALYTNTTGYENTAIGIASLENNNSYYNSALGAFSLNKNTLGHDNTGLGYYAMNQNSTGVYNTSVGAFSMSANTSGGQNVAVGYKALSTNLGGFYNSALGASALQGNQSGDYNSAFGTAALSASNSDFNSAFGYTALRNNAGGLGNTAIGLQSLHSNVSGSWNTAIGMNAGIGLPNNVSNVTCIGSQTGWATTSSNQVNIGDFSVSWIGGQTGWFHYSDKRIKNDIKEDVPGLSFITRLKPITYHVDIDKQEEIANSGTKTNQELIRPITNNNGEPDQYLNKPVQKDWEGKYDVEKIKMTGFFAQDVEEAAKSINYSFNGVHNPKNGGLYSLDYSAFVVPLVKAVQEQQSIIEKQQKQIDDLLKRIVALEKK